MKFFQNKGSMNQNGFLRDPVLFRIASHLPAEFLANFEDIGAFTASAEAQDLARLANHYRPQIYYKDESQNCLELVELHPAYHALVRRSKDIGLAHSLWEKNPAEKGMRYEVRAIKLFLMAGLEAAHLQEVIQTSAGIGALMNEPDLYHSLGATLLNRKHDNSFRPIQEKNAVSLGIAYDDKELANRALLHRGIAHLVAFENNFSSNRYELKAIKTRVINPNADAFFITAEVEGALSCFFVPRFNSDKKINNIKIERMVEEAGYHACPVASMYFDGSSAWLVGQIGAGAKILNDIETMLHFDELVISAGVLRNALQFALTFLKTQKTTEKNLALTKRVFADIALDIAAAECLSFRLARAFDNAAKDRSEAAFARIITPVAAFWINGLVAPILSEIIAQVGAKAYRQDSVLARLLRDANQRQLLAKTTNQLVEDVVRAAEKAPNFFLQVISHIEPYLGTAGPKTLEILQAATQIALADLGTGRILVEQMAFAAASAVLNTSDIPVVANAFAESRLGGQWRTNYGMLSPRHNPQHILDALYPSV